MSKQHSLPTRRALSHLAVAIAVVLCASTAAADEVEVQIQGIDDPLLTNARKSLSLAAAHDKPWDAAHIRRLYRLAPVEIKNALRPYGYFNATVDAALKPPPKDSKTWQARFQVKRGPATKIGRLTLTATGPGATVPGVQKALRESKLAAGERLVQPQYSATKSALRQAAYNAGYLQAKFSQSAIRVQPKANSADVALVLATGPRYYFGNVDFRQDVIYDALARRYVAFAPGQPFNDDALVQLQLDLAQTQYFSQININADRDNPNRVAPVAPLQPWFFEAVFPDAPAPPIAGQLRVPVTVAAEPSKAASYRVSGGYGTDTGPRVGLGIDLRHINKRGHTFSTDLQLSQIQQRLQAAYVIPIRNVQTDKLSFTAHVENQQFGDIDAFNYGLGALRDIGWRFGRRRASVNLLRSTYDLHDDAGNRTAFVWYPEYTWTLRRANQSLNPDKGVQVVLDAKGASETLGSSTRFIQGNAKASAIYPLAAWIDGVVRGEFGATAAKSFADVPPSLRFFAGGQHSVRGYGYQSISPTNGDRVDVGGKFLATASAEADYWVYGDFGFATFYDIGDAANDLGFDFKQSVGVGFRWKSPIGLVAFDVSHPLDGKHGPVGIGFSIGPRL